jgi:hypothetical protein
LRDHGGFGGDLSPAAGSAPYPGEPVSIITSSAWQWCIDSNSFEIFLESAPTWCLTNNNADAVMRPCRGNQDQLWQETGGTPFHLQNIGSDYLCAEGASDAAIIKLSGCTTYRDTWGFEFP